MPGSPVSRPVTTTGEPKPPAPRAPGAMTRPSTSARIPRLAFMGAMDSRREESSRSRLPFGIGEGGEKKGAIEPLGYGSSRRPAPPGMVRAGTGRAGPATLGSMPPRLYLRLGDRVHHAEHREWGEGAVV